MGGSAFSTGPDPLLTPRMPKHVYETVKRRCHVTLRELYYCVASPIEGPAKADFGDVDVLVAWPKDDKGVGRDGLKIIAEALNSARAIVSSGDIVSQNLAIPWPEDCPPASNLASESEFTQPDSGEQHAKRHIQVDIRVCSSVDELQYMLFRHAHGDMWNLLGTTIRPYGLTIDDAALWLRIPEIEGSGKARAKVFLTSDIFEILHFLGLPALGYWEEPFASLEDMYEYAATCRMFSVRSETRPAIDLTDDKRGLKSNDRRRMTGRPAFRT